MGVRQPVGRCRLCGANDRDNLAGEIARAGWNAGVGRDDLPDSEKAAFREDAGDYWQIAHRRYAQAMLDVVGRLI